MVKTLLKCKLLDVSQGPTLHEGLSKSFLGQVYCFFSAHMRTPNPSSFPTLEDCTIAVPVLHVNLKPIAIEARNEPSTGELMSYQTLESISVAKITQE